MAKVTGIGGVFFKSTGDSAALAAWYRKHLGSCGRGVWTSSKDPNRTRMASLPGSWTQTETRSSSGNRRSGTTRTKVPESAA